MSRWRICLPRITRAQSIDALSSTSTVAGFKAVLRAENLPRMFPMLMTAAGTIPPARVLVVGAGVAGLQAIATARRNSAAHTGGFLYYFGPLTSLEVYVGRDTSTNSKVRSVFVAGRSVSTAEFERTGFRGAASDPRSSGAYGAP